MDSLAGNSSQGLRTLLVRLINTPYFCIVTMLQAAHRQNYPSIVEMHVQVFPFMTTINFFYGSF